MFHRYRSKSRKLEGALTVEAALVLPIFIYFMIAFIYLLQVIHIHELIQDTITEIGYDTAKYAYVYHRIEEYKKEPKKKEPESGANQDNITSQVSEDSIFLNKDVIVTRGIGSTYYKLKINSYLEEDFINNSCVKNGINGITTYLSSFMEYEDTIDIVVMYKIKIPLGFLSLDEIPMMQRIRLKGWNGWQVNHGNEDDSNLEEVYVALHGEVYHKTKNCTYINIKVEEIPFVSINLIKNKNGESYSECNICVKGQTVNYQHIYITSTGNKYHIRLDCSSLKRTVSIISIKEIGSLRPCSKCYKKKN